MRYLPPSGMARGFSLIELLVVVAIVAILGRIAYPSYVEHVRKGKRTESQSVMLEAEQYMQRFYAAKNSYTGASLSSVGLNQSPKVGTKAYDLRVDVAEDGLSYTLTADPVDAGDPCGDLTLTSTGAKGQTGTATRCWN